MKKAKVFYEIESNMQTVCRTAHNDGATHRSSSGAKFGLMLTRRLFVNGLMVLSSVCLCVCVCVGCVTLLEVSVVWDFYVLWE